METEISRTWRHLSPAHYSLKVGTYSLLSQTTKYESGVFEAGGYKWRLIFYPNGDKENGGENYVSLYLSIVETDSLSWEVNVDFKLFVHNQVKDKYLTVQDLSNGGVKRFHSTKTVWGISQLILLETLKDHSNGYIVNDTCVFGAEIFVINQTGKWESLSLVKPPNISNSTFTWEIESFSGLTQESYNSTQFTVGERNWFLKMYPKGDKDKKSLSLFLVPSNNWKSQIPNNPTMIARYKLRVVNQFDGKHCEKEAAEHCFSGPVYQGWGFPSLISLDDLQKKPNGFIVNDTLIVEVEFLVISTGKYFEIASSDTINEPLAEGLRITHI